MDVDAEDAIVPDVTTSSTEIYERKRKQLFDSLCTAEKSLEGTILEQRSTGPDSDVERRHPNRRGVTNRNADFGARDISERRFHGQESIFKKPPPGIMKCLKPRRTPGYQVNPHKWKKYSLSDADTSDRTNTAAAFEFLREIEERKRNEVGDMDTAEPESADKKIVFKKRIRPDLAAKFNQSVHLRNQLDEGVGDQTADKAVLKGSKVVMPEYVIGQKVAKEKRLKSGRSSGKADRNQLKLGHLLGADEEEEE